MPTKPLSTQGLLGYAYLEKGDVMQAIPVLESAVQAAQQYRSQQVQSWFKVFLGEAYRVNNQLEQARTSPCRGCAASPVASTIRGA